MKHLTASTSPSPFSGENWFDPLEADPLSVRAFIEAPKRRWAAVRAINAPAAPRARLETASTSASWIARIAFRSGGEGTHRHPPMQTPRERSGTNTGVFRSAVGGRRRIFMPYSITPQRQARHRASAPISKDNEQCQSRCEPGGTRSVAPVIDRGGLAMSPSSVSTPSSNTRQGPGGGQIGPQVDILPQHRQHAGRRCSVMPTQRHDGFAENVELCKKRRPSWPSGGSAAGAEIICVFDPPQDGEIGLYAIAGNSAPDPMPEVTSRCRPARISARAARAPAIAISFGER